MAPPFPSSPEACAAPGCPRLQDCAWVCCTLHLQPAELWRDATVLLCSCSDTAALFLMQERGCWACLFSGPMVSCLPWPLHQPLPVTQSNQRDPAKTQVTHAPPLLTCPSASQYTRRKPEPGPGPASSGSLTSQISSLIPSPVVPHRDSRTDLAWTQQACTCPALCTSCSLFLEGPPPTFLHFAPSPPLSLHSNLTFSMSPSLSTVIL